MNTSSKQKLVIDLEAQLKGFYKLVFKIQPSLLGSTNSNFGEYPQDFLCFLETNFWGGEKVVIK